MVTYIIISAVLLVIFILIAIGIRLIDEEDKAENLKQCPNLLTMSTPITLSLHEVSSGDLEEVLERFAPSAKLVPLGDSFGVEITLSELLNLMFQKMNLHDQELVELISFLEEKSKGKTVRKGRSKE
jgi:hypothetical protein